MVGARYTQTTFVSWKAIQITLVVGTLIPEAKNFLAPFFTVQYDIDDLCSCKFGVVPLEIQSYMQSQGDVFETHVEVLPEAICLLTACDGIA